MILVQFQELLYRQISLNFQLLSTAVLFDFTAVKNAKTPLNKASCRQCGKQEQAIQGSQQ